MDQLRQRRARLFSELQSTGDGVKFKGHGPIQITGRAAHKACGQFLGVDLVKDPRLLTKPEYGLFSAAWFWSRYKPPLKASTWLLWAGPALLFVLGLGLLVRLVRQRARLLDEAFDEEPRDDA